MKKCPKCGCSTFYVNAHIVQGWLVDEDGDFISVTEECVETTHAPDDDDLWTCSKCGHEATGAEMEEGSHDSAVRRLSEQKTINICDDSFIGEVVLDKNDEVIESDGRINFYIPIYFDADKAFGLDVCTTENDDYVSLYVNWSPSDGISVLLSYYTHTPGVNDFSLDVVMNNQQKQRFYSVLQAECLSKYNKTLDAMYNEFTKED